MANHAMRVGGFAGGYLGGHPGGAPLSRAYPEGFLGGTLRGRTSDFGDDAGGSGEGGSSSGGGGGPAGIGGSSSDGSPASASANGDAPAGPAGGPASTDGPPSSNPTPNTNPSMFGAFPSDPDPVNPYAGEKAFSYNPYAPGTMLSQLNTHIDATNPNVKAYADALRGMPFPFTDAIKGMVPFSSILGLTNPSPAAKGLNAAATIAGTFSGMPGFSSAVHGAINAADVTNNAIAGQLGISPSDANAVAATALGGNSPGASGGQSGGGMAIGNDTGVDTGAANPAASRVASSPAVESRSPIVNQQDDIKKRFGGLAIGV